MATKGRKPGFVMTGRFYVYCIHDGDGFPVYVGKGTGRRVKLQAKRFGRPAYIPRRFRCEDDAFKFEAKMVSELSPVLNRCAGGGGSRATTKRERVPRWAREIERVGTKVYAARGLLKFDLSGFISPEQLARIKQVAAIS